MEGSVKLVKFSFVDVDAQVLVRFPCCHGATPPRVSKHSQNQKEGADELTLRAEEKGKALAFNNIKEINCAKLGPPLEDVRYA